MVRPERPSHTLKILSANVRGLRTDIGDLTHNCVLRHSTDVVVVTETWLNNEVEPTFGKIRGYTQQTRRDRPERAGGGVAVCFKEGVQAQHLDVVPPPHMEMMFFRVVLADRSATLVCAMYRPPRQGPSSLQYLTGALDDLMLEHRCRHVLVVGDLNHHLEQHVYESLQTVQVLTDHVTFPTHIDIGVARDEATSRTVWLWDKADWAFLRHDLSHTAWGTLLPDGADNMSRALTSRLLALQRRHVPLRDYTTKPTDQPWYGYRCRVAAEAKYAEWLRYKRNPTRRNKDLHRAACRRMVVSSKWAIQKLEDDLPRKLRSPGVGNKTWWSLVKEKQGISHQDSIPPLTKQDGTGAVTFAPEKTQAMVVSRSLAAGPAVAGRLRFGGVPLPLQEAVKVLGVEVDRELKFDGHIKHIAKKASHRVSTLRRVASFLDRGGRLDSIQRRALRLVDAADLPDPLTQIEPVSPLDSLEYRRDVAALVVFHKAQVQGVAWLAELREPPRIATRSTRTVLTSGDAVEVPRSRARQHQRTFVGRVSKMWNIFTAAVPHIHEMNTQSVKLAANRC
ncbi:hypothetical protein GWK47_048890 [Chionoecetes opilio]|uniref:Endonuclease/exonuclease/phosphatase domain-containing protein n=1 Tax=Chionoecetes opilio TaxID=41210 RepID=A0A8J4YCC4_CHIOP|nr:hypothetical protein GWK47_048890 [Chionoecetes opilio]